MCSIFRIDYLTYKDWINFIIKDLGQIMQNKKKRIWCTLCFCHNLFAYKFCVSFLSIEDTISEYISYVHNSVLTSKNLLNMHVTTII